MLPCCCSLPQVGGLERRLNNFLESLQLQWPGLLSRWTSATWPSVTDRASAERAGDHQVYLYSLEAMKRYRLPGRWSGRYEASCR